MKRSKFGQIVTTLYFIGLFGVVAISYTALFLKPLGIDEGRKETITIQRGMTVSHIAQTLRDSKLIYSPKLFVLAARLLGVEKKLKTGRYTIPSGLSHYQSLQILIDGNEVLTKVTIPEGATSRMIASVLQREMKIDSTVFMALVNDPETSRKLGIDANSLEGYLYPDTYLFPYSFTAENVIHKMVKQFHSIAQDSWEQQMKDIGFTLHEVVTLASIIQGEIVYNEEATTVSAVYHNRLKRHIRLQADPTVQYIIPDGPRRLLIDDLRIDSPYNTYKYFGLPPGPINNPGDVALKAALSPEDVDYLFFVSDGEGKHIFTRTIDEHRKARKKLDNARKRQRRSKKRRGTSE